MSRMKYVVGDKVYDTTGEPDLILTVKRVEPALDLPYFLNNGEWYDEAILVPHATPTPTWEDVEVSIKTIVNDLRRKFEANDENYMSFTICASGRPSGDIKIKYSIRDKEYSGEQVSGYSLRPTLDELFRRKKWVERNIPLVLTHDGGEGVASPDDD